MRPLLTLAALALAAAACTPGEAAQRPAETPAVDTTVTASPTGPILSRAETAYLKAFDAETAKYLDADDSVDEETYLEKGHEVCDQAKEDRAEAVQAAMDAPEDERDIHKAALTRLCPKLRALWTFAAGGFGDGKHTVGSKGIRPGTYRTLQKPVTDCYWERSTGAGGIVANQLVTNAPRGVTVTVRAGEGFTSRGCGPWIRG